MEHRAEREKDSINDRHGGCAVSQSNTSFVRGMLVTLKREESRVSGWPIQC